jgi:hypothetical protein
VVANVGGREEKTARLVEILVAVHEGYIYQAYATEGEAGVSHTQALQEIQQGWRFNELVTPSTYMEFRPEAVRVFRRFKINFLATMRPSPDQARPDILQVRTFNYRRGRPDFLMTMQVLVTTPGVTLEQVGNQLAAEAGAGRDEPIVWKTLEASPRRIISRSFQMGSSTTHPMDVRVGLVQLSQREVAMVNFGLVTPDNFDRTIYEDKAESIVMTVQPVERSGAATHATGP